MESYEEFKKSFLEVIKVQGDKEGWNSVCCQTTSMGKNSYTWAEVWEGLVNETGLFGNVIRNYYKYASEKSNAKV